MSLNRPVVNLLTKISNLNDHLVLSNHRIGDIGWDFMALVDLRLSCDVIIQGWTTTHNNSTSLSAYLNIKRDPITSPTLMCVSHHLKRTHLYRRGTSPAQPALLNSSF